MNDELKKNIRSNDLWLRFVYMVLFAFVLYMAMMVFFLVSVVQFLFVLISAERNPKLLSFSDSLGKYIAQCVHFETFVSEQKPFPFSDFPEPDSDDDNIDDTHEDESGDEKG